MSALIYEILTSSALISIGLYHLTSTVRSFLRSPTTFSARPFPPLSLSSPSRLRHLPLYLTLAFLSLSSLLSLSLSLSLSSPLPHLSSSLVSLLFLLLSLSLLLLPDLPPDLLFALFSSAFALRSLSLSSPLSPSSPPSISSHCSAISARISLLSAALSLLLAALPKLFPADALLGGSLCLQGLWALQTGLSLHVDAFVPEGCHRLLEDPGLTKCDLDESRLRAFAVLDLAFAFHAALVVLLVLLVYGVSARALGAGAGAPARRLGPYEALPNTAGDGNNVVQMKTLTGTQA